MLPNADRAVIDVRKLRDYVLSMDNDRGKHKALVFRSVSGSGRDDAEWLRDRILSGVLVGDATQTDVTPYGVLYRVDVPVETVTGVAIVRTGWIVRSGEAFPRLTTCYVL